jgi:hypothetical protein
MNLNTFTSLIEESFGFKSLCLINSSAHAFTHLLLNQHLVLSGGNNQGKTAALNVVKLFLFPEFNFSNCKTKFGFQGRDGTHYTKQDSFEHYFPSNKSFINAEAENPEGSFCVVLFRSSEEFGYGRALVPCSFDDIKDLFWNFESNNNENMGEAKNLDKAELISILKKKKATFVNDSKTLSEHLFGGANKLTSRRFCLVPLIDGGTKESIECLRSLINLAFDLTASNQDTLPKVLSSVIEMGKDREQSKVKVNLHKSLAQFKELKQRKELLERIENHRFLWEQTDNSIKEYKKELVDGAKLYFGIERQIETELKSIEPKLKELVQEHGTLNTAYLNEKQIFNSLKSELIGIKANLKQKQDDYKPVKEQLKILNETMGSWGSSWNQEQAIADCKNDLEKYQNIVNAFNDSSGARVMLENALEKKKKLSEEVSSINQSINNTNSLLLAKVSPEAASVLNTLNDKFAVLSSEVTPQDIEKIEDFTALFSLENNRLIFSESEIYGVTTKSFDINQVVNTLKIRFSAKQKEFDNIEDEVLRINDIIKGSPKGTREEAIKDRDEAVQELNVLKRAEFIPEEHQNFVDTIKRLEEEFTSKSKQRDELSEKQGLAKTKLDTLKDGIDQLQPKRNDLARYQQRIQTASIEYQERFDSLKNFNVDETSYELNDEFIDQSYSKITSIKSFYSESISNLKQLFAQSFIPEFDEMTHKTQYQSHEIDHALIEFDTLFNTVYQKQDQLSNEIHAHNSDVNAEIEEIRDGSRLIDSKVNEINSIFEGREISNLESIKMRVEKNTQFDELMVHLDRNNVHGNELLDEEFYERLNYFCQSHFTSKDGITTIQMQSLIKSVKYQYQKKGTDIITSKPQSGGTTAATNCILLAVLMNELVSDSVKLSLPLVLDEIGNLDDNNIPEVRKVADQYGFNVFAATPDLNPSALDSLNNFVTLGEFVCEGAIEPEAITICYDRDEFFGKEPTKTEGLENAEVVN